MEQTLNVPNGMLRVGMIYEHTGRKWASFTFKVDQKQKRGYTGFEHLAGILVCNIPYT